eukprot:366365-Chlamydomonas_euryale.AAC.6
MHVDMRWRAMLHTSAVVHVMHSCTLLQSSHARLQKCAAWHASACSQPAGQPASQHASGSMQTALACHVAPWGIRGGA